MNDTIEKIKNQIKNNSIILYMKGTPNIPKCGFSSKAVKVLSNCTQSFVYIDVLTHSDIRYALPIFSNWPTFPQLWIEGNLIGGADIIIDLYNKGELKILIDKIKTKQNITD